MGVVPCWNPGNSLIVCTSSTSLALSACHAWSTWLPLYPLVTPKIEWRGMKVGKWNRNIMIGNNGYMRGRRWLLWLLVKLIWCIVWIVIDFYCRALGREVEVVSPREISEMVPWMRTDDLEVYNTLSDCCIQTSMTTILVGYCGAFITGFYLPSGWSVPSPWCRG